MNKEFTVEEKRELIDHVTDSMFSLNFLMNFENAISMYPNTPIRKFYIDWQKSINTPEEKIPFSLGSFVGYMYCGFVIIKEVWIELIPDKKINELPEEWGLKNIKIIKTEKEELEYFLTKIRNSISHADFNIKIPDNANRRNIMDKTIIIFKDKDKFETHIKMTDLTKTIKKLHGLAHTHSKKSMSKIQKALKLIKEHHPPSEARAKKQALPHVTRVGEYLSANNYSEEIILAGYLHDIIEWSDIDPQIIADEFGQRVLDIVKANSKDRGIDDKDERITEMAKRCSDLGEDALIVKAADTIDSFKHYTKTKNQSELEYCAKNARAVLQYRTDDKIFKELELWASK